MSKLVDIFINSVHNTIERLTEEKIKLTFKEFKDIISMFDINFPIVKCDVLENE